MKHRWAILAVLVGVITLGGAIFPQAAKWMAVGAWQYMNQKHTVEDRVEQYGPAVHARLMPHFNAAGVTYPPVALTLVGLKDEKRLEVWAANAAGQMRLITGYPILRASGELGPKLREGDRQVPEGLYRITGLNPNSSFHLSLRVDYPNEFDWARAREEGRETPGSDIFIHGRESSVGCLAMGDEAAEDLFVLAAETGLENIAVILAPVDFRVRDLPPLERELPSWSEEVHADVKEKLGGLVKK
jgi:hypothetical protein